MKSTIAICFVLMVVFTTFSSCYEHDSENIVRSYPNLKRGSLSNMMRIGKRQQPQQDYVQFPNDTPLACESCNLGTLMRIGRRR